MASKTFDLGGRIGASSVDIVHDIAREDQQQRGMSAAADVRTPANADVRTSATSDTPQVRDSANADVRTAARPHGRTEGRAAARKAARESGRTEVRAKDDDVVVIHVPRSAVAAARAEGGSVKTSVFVPDELDARARLYMATRKGVTRQSLMVALLDSFLEAEGA